MKKIISLLILLTFISTNTTLAMPNKDNLRRLYPPESETTRSNVGATVEDAAKWGDFANPGTWFPEDDVPRAAGAAEAGEEFDGLMTILEERDTPRYQGIETEDKVYQGARDGRFNAGQFIKKIDSVVPRIRKSNDKVERAILFKICDICRRALGYTGEVNDDVLERLEWGLSPRRPLSIREASAISAANLGVQADNKEDADRVLKILKDKERDTKKAISSTKDKLGISDLLPSERNELNWRLRNHMTAQELIQFATDSIDARRVHPFLDEYPVFNEGSPLEIHRGIIFAKAQQQEQETAVAAQKLEEISFDELLEIIEDPSRRIGQDEVIAEAEREIYGRAKAGEFTVNDILDAIDALEKRKVGRGTDEEIRRDFALDIAIRASGMVKGYDEISETAMNWYLNKMGNHINNINSDFRTRVACIIALVHLAANTENQEFRNRISEILNEASIYQIYRGKLNPQERVKLQGLYDIAKDDAREGRVGWVIDGYVPFTSPRAEENMLAKRPGGGSSGWAGRSGSVRRYRTAQRPTTFTADLAVEPIMTSRAHRSGGQSGAGSQDVIIEQVIQARNKGEIQNLSGADLLLAVDTQIAALKQASLEKMAEEKQKLAELEKIAEERRDIALDNMQPRGSKESFTLFLFNGNVAETLQPILKRAGKENVAVLGIKAENGSLENAITQEIDIRKRLGITEVIYIYSGERKVSNRFREGLGKRGIYFRQVEFSNIPQSGIEFLEEIDRLNLRFGATGDLNELCNAAQAELARLKASGA